ncbi:MAG: YHYH protein [Bacteroidia bacterium]|nr:YHYH protein [Bacteroidia bacterium]
MKKSSLSFLLLLSAGFTQAQLSPAITSWLQNTTETGSYYVAGNSTAIANNILVNCQKVEYSADYVYVTATGVPAYPTGPFQDGNPSQATNQNGIYRIPLAPQQNTGTPTSTNGGNIGIFINGVALFDYRDGVAWNPNTNALCGGPGNPMCPGGPQAVNAWNRDAIPAEKPGFDCSKGHPANGNYHHHQNPSAFKLDLEVLSTVCNLYDAEGLYALDSSAHSPLIGFAYDGFPIYGAYGYKNTDGTGGIARIKSGYELRNITERTEWADGTDVVDGPAVNATYFLGYFREDYGFVEHPGEGDYLDVHNGRFCVTPEYPNGTYAYFATVNEDWTSAYPYVVGPTFYGVSANRKVTTIGEATTVYTGSTGISDEAFQALNISIYPNPSSDILAVQLGGLNQSDLNVELVDLTGKLISSTVIKKGSTIAYFDVQTVYEGTYLISVSDARNRSTKKVVITKE